MLQPAVSENPIGDAAVELGILRRLQGRRVEAMRTMSLILSRDIAGASAADYVRAGRAARAIGRFQQANDFFREAVNRAPTDVNANIAWGELFLEKYERREAARSFEAALRGDANHPVALLGMARTVARGQPAGGAQAGAADARREPQRGRRPRAAGADRPRRPEAR